MSLSDAPSMPRAAKCFIAIASSASRSVGGRFRKRSRGTDRSIDQWSKLRNAGSALVPDAARAGDCTTLDPMSKPSAKEAKLRKALDKARSKGGDVAQAFTDLANHLRD